MQNDSQEAALIGSLDDYRSEFLIDESRRRFLCGAGLLVAGMMMPRARADDRQSAGANSEHKVIVVIIGGVRRAETFSREGLLNIPHLATDLLPKALFYPHARNEGVTAHFNAISSILTGNWQRVDDWGKLAPTTPTDGSSTNGFFNHRANDDSTRDTWMMALGAAIDKPQIVERPIRHVDVCPTLANLLGCKPMGSQGERLNEIRG